MRIIGGKYRGRSLFTPSDDRIRPTTDRVRESLFNIISHMPGFDFNGAYVLDMFCGTGALGIEALSRGGDHCSFVDSNRQSITLTKRNGEKILEKDSATYLNMTATKAASDTRLPAKAANLVFLDPPYGNDLAGPVLNALPVSYTHLTLPTKA